LAKLRLAINPSVKPQSGWVRAIRQSLGMNTEQLGKRMGVSQPRVTVLEHSEAAGAINLKTLQRAADALNCTLVYALVPNEPLEQMVQKQARQVAAEHLDAAERTMALEGQQASAEARREQLAETADTLVKTGSRVLWRK